MDRAATVIAREVRSSRPRANATPPPPRTHVGRVTALSSILNERSDSTAC